MAYDSRFLSQLSDAYERGHVSSEALKRLLELKYGKDSEIEKELLDKACSDAAASGSGRQTDLSAPRISVVIATHNRIEMLCRCIDSILEQRYPDIEVVVVDDCSTDDTQEVIPVRYPSVRYYRNDKNLGPGRARQKGYNLSAGAYVIFSDDDDFYVDPQFFAKAAEILALHENVAMVCANSAVYYTESKELKFFPFSFAGMMSGKKYLKGFMTKYLKPQSTFPAVLRKSVLEQAGFKDMQMMNDTSIYLRTLCFGDVYALEDWIGVYWVHGGSIGRGLPHQFIIGNLDEKRRIYLLVRKVFGRDMPSWYCSQLMITINHYLNSRRLETGKFLSVLWWIVRYGHPARKRLIRETVKTQWKQMNKRK